MQYKETVKGYLLHIKTKILQIVDVEYLCTKPSIWFDSGSLCQRYLTILWKNRNIKFGEWGAVLGPKRRIFSLRANK